MRFRYVREGIAIIRREMEEMDESVTDLEIIDVWGNRYENDPEGANAWLRHRMAHTAHMLEVDLRETWQMYERIDGSIMAALEWLRVGTQPPG